MHIRRLPKKILSADYADYTDFKKIKALNNGAIYRVDLPTSLQCHKDGVA
jgi:hypothetical protein